MTRVPILDDEGAITEELYAILQQIFADYARVPLSSLPEPDSVHPEGETSCGELTAAQPDEPVWDRRRMNQFARDTNGHPLDDPSWVEITTYFDCVYINDDDDGGSESSKQSSAQDRRRPAMTMKGFTQMYELQTSADEDETWRDLTAWGYNERLEKKLVDEAANDGDHGAASSHEEAAPAAETD